MSKNIPNKDIVKDFWNRNVCHVSFIKNNEIGSRAFFEETESLRYKYPKFFLARKAKSRHSHAHPNHLFDQRILAEMLRGRTRSLSIYTLKSFL